MSVLLGYHFHLERLFTLGPGNFYPAPKVDSIVLRLLPRRPELPATDEHLLKQVVKAAFATRRKTLKNALSAASSLFHLSPADLIQILHHLDIDPARRPETLSVTDFVRLSNALGAEVEIIPQIRLSPFFSNKIRILLKNSSNIYI